MPSTILYVAADLYNGKCNLELTFPTVPSLSDLLKQVQNVFAAEVVAIRPPDAKLQNFGISKLQVYDDNSATWEGLASPSQLQNFSQLYVIQSDPNYSESQEQIPVARKPACYTSPGLTANAGQSAAAAPANTPMDIMSTGQRAPYNTPVAGQVHDGAAFDHRTAAVPKTDTSSTEYVRVQRHSTTAGESKPSGIVEITPRSTSFGQVAMPLFGSGVSQGDKVHVIWDDASQSNPSRSVQEVDLRNVFYKVNIDLNPNIIAALFRQADNDRDALIGFNDLHSLLREYPTLTDALFFRLRDLQEGEVLQQRLAEEMAKLEEALRRRDQLGGNDRAAAAQLEELMQRRADMEQGWQKHLAAENDIKNRLAKEHELFLQLRDMLNMHRNEMSASQGNEDQARRAVAASEKELEYRVQQHTKALANKAAADARVRDLMEQLEAARAEVRQHESTIAQYEANIKEAEDRFRQCQVALKQLGDDVQNRNSAMDTIDKNMLVVQERQHRAEGELEMQQHANEKLAMLIENQDKERQNLEQLREKTKADGAALEALIRELEKRVKACEANVQAFAQRRAALEAKERPLIEQEIRLKEQRLLLDISETKLRREASSVFDSHVRTVSYER